MLATDFPHIPFTHILETRQVFGGCVEAFEDVAKEEGNCVGAIPDNGEGGDGETDDQGDEEITCAVEGAVAFQALQQVQHPPSPPPESPSQGLPLPSSPR